MLLLQPAPSVLLLTESFPTRKSVSERGIVVEQCWLPVRKAEACSGAVLSFISVRYGR